MLELKNISKKFGDKIIFDQFNLTVEEGKTLSLVGPSGGDGDFGSRMCRYHADLFQAGSRAKKRGQALV